MKRIQAVEHLRAISALLVVTSHIKVTYFLGVERGAYAVGIFYVISAFLALYTTTNKLSINDNIKSIIKKILRIIPMYYIFNLFAYLLVSLKPDWFNTATASPVNLIKTLLFIPYENLNGIVRPILDVSWFLILIFWFNIVFGIAKIISHKYRGIITITILGMVYALCEIFISDNAIFEQYKYGILSMIGGILLYYLYERVLSKVNFKSKKSIIWNLMLYALLMLGVYLYSFIINKDLRELAELIPVTICLTFIFLDNKISDLKIISLISKVSFSLYLSHQFVVKGVSRLIYSIDDLLTPVSFGVTLICIVICVVVAWIIYEFLEKTINNCVNKIINGK